MATHASSPMSASVSLSALPLAQWRKCAPSSADRTVCTCRYVCLSIQSYLPVRTAQLPQHRLLARQIAKRAY
eukprot:7382706-Prymnesium_polylepis.2